MGVSIFIASDSRQQKMKSRQQTTDSKQQTTDSRQQGGGRGVHQARMGVSIFIASGARCPCAPVFLRGYLQRQLAKLDESDYILVTNH
jgi:hypothetical protein